MKFFKNGSLLAIACYLLMACSVQKKLAVNKERPVWTKEMANSWYAKQGWLVGANFMPSTAINQLEMWQPETFDTATISRELGWAQALGMNTARVFLHDLLYQQDSTGLYNRMDVFLNICQRNRIRPLFVFFDSVWDPFPKEGKQRDPKPHVHNSGWVQSPGISALQDSTQYPRLERYVKGVVARFAGDNRIIGWDVWNEPDNPNESAYGKVELQDKVKYVLPLLRSSFSWVRSQNPTQPVTSGIWAGNWSTHETLKPLEKLQVEESD
ncbi:MAG TPA: 1,4-beta-xylanase, partial [Chitinophagaceae bacterium]|nr:1,4-beta-xylanase [Chitinophagaceae bacterium]